MYKILCSAKGGAQVDAESKETFRSTGSSGRRIHPDLGRLALDGLDQLAEVFECAVAIRGGLRATLECVESVARVLHLLSIRLAILWFAVHPQFLANETSSKPSIPDRWTGPMSGWIQLDVVSKGLSSSLSNSSLKVCSTTAQVDLDGRRRIERGEKTDGPLL